MPKFHNVSPQVDLPAMEQDVLAFLERGRRVRPDRRSRPRPGRATSSTRGRRPRTAGPASTMCWRGRSRTSSRATRPCAATTSRARAAGTRTACRSSSRSRRSWASPARKRSRSTASRPSTSSCRQSVFDYVEEWEKLTERLGYWVDLPTAYWTLTNDYVESLWWILKQYWDRGLIYQGYKVVPYCPRCGTPLSSHELAQGYQEGTKDPSVYVKFPLRDQPGVYLLVWTTTPWTLPGNVAVAVGEEIDYVLVQHEDDKLWLAEALLGIGLRGARGPCDRAAPGEGPRAAGLALSAALHLPAGDAGLLLRHLRRFRQHGGWHGPGAHRAGLRRRRHDGGAEVRPAHADDGGRAGPLHRHGDAVARHLRQGGRSADPEGSDRPRADVQAGDLRAHLPVLLAL